MVGFIDDLSASTHGEFLEEADRAIKNATEEGIDLTYSHPKYSRAHELQEELELKSNGLASLLFFEILEGESLEALSEKDNELVSQVLNVLRAGSNTPRIHYSKENKTQHLIDMCHALSVRGYTLPKEYQTYLNAPHSEFPNHVQL